MLAGQRKLMIVTDAWAPQVNGVERTVRMLEDELCRIGVQVTLLTPEGFWTIPVPSYSEIRLAIATQSRVSKIIEQDSPSAVHIATEGPLGQLARRHCIRFGRKFTTCYHTRYPEYVAARAPIPLARLAESSPRDPGQHRPDHGTVGWFHTIGFNSPRNIDDVDVHRSPLCHVSRAHRPDRRRRRYDVAPPPVHARRLPSLWQSLHPTFLVSDAHGHDARMTCLSSPRATRCVHAASRRPEPGSPGRDTMARAPPPCGVQSVGIFTPVTASLMNSLFCTLPSPSASNLSSSSSTVLERLNASA